jgi:hypothetical protein
VGHTLDKFANVVVTRIDRGRIVLQNGAHREELLLDPQAPKVSTVAPSRRAPQSRNRRRGPASANASLDARLGKLNDRAPSQGPASVLNGASKLPKKDKSGNMHQQAQSARQPAPVLNGARKLPKKDKSGNMHQKSQSARQHAVPGEKAATASGSGRRSRSLYQGSVAECVRRNWQRCIDRYGEGNCDVWSNVDSVPIGAFGIDLPWCSP